MLGLFINHDKACTIRGQRKPFPAFRKSSHCRGFKTTPLMSTLSVMLKQMICRMPGICWQITYLLSAEFSQHSPPSKKGMSKKMMSTSLPPSEHTCPLSGETSPGDGKRANQMWFPAFQPSLHKGQV